MWAIDSFEDWQVYKLQTYMIRTYADCASNRSRTARNKSLIMQSIDIMIECFDMRFWFQIYFLILLYLSNFLISLFYYIYRIIKKNHVCNHDEQLMGWYVMLKYVFKHYIIQIIIFIILHVLILIRRDLLSRFNILYYTHILN